MDSEGEVHFRWQREVSSQSDSSEATASEEEAPRQQPRETGETGEDLERLQRKINKPGKAAPKAKADRKKSYVPPAYLKTVTLMALVRLYRYQQMVESDGARVLSHFTYDETILMEERQRQASFGDRVMAILAQFQLRFDLKRSSASNKRHTQGTQLYPDQYVIDLGALLCVFGYVVRVVMAVDMKFTGLEKKFRVKAVAKQPKVPMNLPEVSIKGLEGSTDIPAVVEDSLDQFVFTKGKSQGDVSALLKKIDQGPKLRLRLEPKSSGDLLFEANNNLWLELLVEGKGWLPFDPVSDQLCEFSFTHLHKKLHSTCSYFILSTQEIRFTEPQLTHILQDQRLFGSTYFVELSWKYLLSYSSQRIQLGLEKWFNSLMRNERLVYQSLPNFVRDAAPYVADRNEYMAYRRAQRPTNDRDYKYHPLYAIASQLNQYQIIRPGADPVFSFKEEQVFLKEDVIVLHSRDRWRDYLLEVREGEVPIKEVTGRFDKTKITALFTEWQCQPIKVSLAENDGQLPKNPYGNFECFVCPPPQGTVVFPHMGLKRALLKTTIPFVEAVDGFDMKSNKMFAQKCGYLIFEKDLPEVQKLWEQNVSEIKSRNKVNKVKALQKLWSDLFKAILIKKQITDSYHQQQQ